MMSRSNACAPLAGFAVLLFAAGCSSPTNEAHSLQSEAPIINGTPGGPAQVGRLLWTANGAWYICTGTLVAPDLVLTARHCVYDESDNSERLGKGKYVFQLYDSATKKYTDETNVAETFVPPLTDKNFVGWEAPLGAPDVSLFRLATSITRIAPMPISTTPVSLDNPQFTTAGIGFVSHNQNTAVDTPPWGLSSTALVLSALQGAYMHIPFPTFKAFLAAAADARGVSVNAITASEKASYQGDYDTTLAVGIEAYLQPKVDGQPCHGDSGGPLLQQDAAGKLQVYGTVSGGESVSDTAQCYFGEIYSVISPPVQDFLKLHGLLGTPPTGGSAGAGGMGSAGAASGGSAGVVGATGGGSSGGASSGGTSSGGDTTTAGVAGTIPSASGGALTGTAGAINIGAGAPGIAGQTSGTSGGANDPGGSPDSSGCSCKVAAQPTHGSSITGMLAALVGALVIARRRQRA